MLVLKGLVGLHRTVQLQLLQGYWLGHRLGLQWYWMVCLETNRDHSVIFEFVDEREAPSDSGSRSHMASILYMVNKPYGVSFCSCCCSVTKACQILCNSMDCNMPGFPVPHHLPEFSQVHVYWIGDAIQLSHPLSPSSPAFNLSHHQGLFQWVSCSPQVAKILELQL